jgi:pilus assembly protein CpaE
VGTSFITANVAYLMAQAGQGKVLAVDLDLHYGQLAQFFDLHPKHTIMEVIENVGNLDSAFVQSVLPIYHDNLYVLPAPSRIEKAETVTPEHLGKILSHIRQLGVFRWILVDGGCQLRDITLKALEISEEIILVTTPSVPALTNARSLLELLKMLDLEGASWKFLLNSWNKKSNMTLEEVEKFLDRKITWVVGNDLQMVNRSIDEGRPLAEMGPQLPISQDLSRVAVAFLDPAAANQKVSGCQRLWGWLQGGKQ